MACSLALVVDDDFLVRLNTAEILEDVGFEVIQARDAASALAVLKENSRIDLVCTDVQMPGELDGIDLVQRVTDHHPHIGIIVMSGSKQNNARLPTAPFLMKPFLPSRLVELAREQVNLALPR